MEGLELSINFIPPAPDVTWDFLRVRDSPKIM
jgi:hypothetical protein